MLAFCLDWLSVSLADTAPHEVMATLGLESADWILKDGHNGFRQMFAWRGIGINFDSVFPTTAGYSLLVFSGEGCRTWEEISGAPLADLLKAHPFWKVTRIDLALDDIGREEDAYLDMGVIAYHMDPDNPRLVSRWHTDSMSYTFGPRERTARFGSRSSRVYMRIYDKRLERLKAQISADISGASADIEIPPHWVRLEMEFKAEKAETVASIIRSAPDDLTSLFLGVLTDYITFTEETRDDFTDRNMRRDATVANWWQSFVAGAIPCRLQAGPSKVRQYDRVKEWVRKQIPRNLAICLSVEGEAFLEDVITFGQAKLRPEDKQMIIERLTKNI